MKKNALLILFILIILSTSYLAANDDTFRWSIGEELTYKVKWSFVRLGTLKLQLAGTVNYNGRKLYHARLYLDSNPLLFFVNMHNEYDTYIDDQFRAHIHISNETIDGIEYRTEHHFNYADSTMLLRMVNLTDSGEVKEISSKFQKPLYDGISMVYYARKNIHRDSSDILLSYFGDKEGDVILNFRGSSIDDENKLPLKFNKSYRIDGEIRLVGIAGVTGPYKSWFGGEYDRIPYRAEMKAFVGSVIVELEQVSKMDPAEISENVTLNIR